MMAFFKIFLVPLDLVFLTMDCLRGWLRIFSKPLKAPCAYCGTLTATNDEIRAVHPADKYINLWVFRLLCPCIREKNPEYEDDRRHCGREDMFKWNRFALLACTLALGAMWGSLGTAAVRSGLANKAVEKVGSAAERTGTAAQKVLSEKEKNERRDKAEALYQKAMLASDDTAIKLFERAITTDPTHDEARIELIDRLLSNQNLERAASYLELTKNFDIKDPRLHLQHAMVHARMTRNADARAELELAEPDIAENAKLLTRCALIYKIIGDKPTSRKTLLRALEKDPTHTDARVILSAIFLIEKNKAAAWAIYDKLSDEEKQIVEVKTLHAELLLHQGDVDAALSAYEDIVENHPEFLDGYTRLCTLLREKKNDDRAKTIAEDMVKHSKDKFRHAGHLILAQMFDDKGLYEDALEHAEIVLSESSMNIAAMVSKGNALYKKGDYEKAVRLMETVKRIAPGYLKGQYLLAKCYMKTDRDIEVKELLADIMTVVPDSPVPVMELGNYLYQSKRYKEASAAYEAFLANHPEDVICSNNLAVNLAEGNIRLDRALELAQRNYDRDPANPIYNDALGWVLVRKNRAADAIPLLLVAARGIPGHPEPRYHLGRAYLQLGQKEQAKRELALALKFSNTFTGGEEAKRIMAQLITEAP